MKYLTVQDVLWINLQVTKQENRYAYARLEEATFYQYGYGESLSLIPQSARFLKGFSKLAPFDAGNDATAFVACLSFLKVNGSTLKLEDSSAGDWFKKGVSGDAAAQINSVLGVDPEHHDHDLKPEVREAVAEILAIFPNTIVALGGAASKPEFDVERVVEVAAKF